MHQGEFRKYFKTMGPVVLPVIHVLDAPQAKRNLATVIECGAPGAFLINHDFDVAQFLPIIEECRSRCPDLWLGVNFLGVSGETAFPILSTLQEKGTGVDAYWADDARIDERLEPQAEAESIAKIRESGAWDGLYFGGTAFKKQRAVEPGKYCESASIAAKYMDVVTTSGVATGHPAAIQKILDFRQGAGRNALAIASGISPDNAGEYMAHADAFLVATGINYAGDFYNLDPRRLRRLLQKTRQFAAGLSESVETDSVPDRDWYLRYMAPNVKDPKMAWLDPSSAYVNARAFHAMLDALCQPFHSTPVDVVAGIDAAGYVLGAAMAERLGTGFLTVRKAGKLPVPADQVSFVNYTQRTQHMELRQPAFRKGARVLLVDQWVETGGTMGAAIELVERQDGEVVGIAAICIEETPAGKKLRERYRCATCVAPGSELQRQCNAKSLDYFKDFDWDAILP
jgi:adenine phosphoribosyltransferase|tara:strand:- start:16285 stop:17652 length:1368 start_codon:yes stop_codon:yes gene_type:complete